MSNSQVQTVSWIAIYTLLAVLLAVGAVDIALIRREDSGPTISSTIWSIAKDYPIVVLLVGILLGHLFWPQH